MIVSPPRLVGTRTVAAIFGCTTDRIRHRLAAGTLPKAGYVGKFGNRHVWNMHELCASLFTDEGALEVVVEQLAATTPADPLNSLLCAVDDCGDVEEMLGLCGKHLRRLMTAWRHADRSTLVTMQLVAMCQWIVDRNAHLVLPPGFDPWANVCMTPGCGGTTNVHGDHAHGAWHGPLCLACSAKFWNNPPGSRRGLFEQAA